MRKSRQGRLSHFIKILVKPLAYFDALRYHQPMYVNLILLLVTVAAAWIVLQRLFVREDTPGKPEKLKRDTLKKPGDILLEELQKRQNAIDMSPGESSADIPGVRMQPLIDALRDMHAAMPDPMQGALAWHDDGPSVRVRISPAGGKAYILAVGWREALAASAGNAWEYGAGGGFYELRHPDGELEQAENLQMLLHLLARIIADRLS